jgi:hypothetical protein
MPAPSSYDYAVVRVVPRVERQEFINAGVILHCPALGFLGARVELDSERLRGLAPLLDPVVVRRYLDLIPLVCAGGKDAGPIGRLGQRERFHWLVSPRSTVLQTSPVHSGLCADPVATLDHLLATLVRLPPIEG